MTRSRPPSLTTLVRRTLLDECGVERGDAVLVAVSGGSDSMALLHALGLLRRELRLELVAAGVDHGLRETAAAELDLVARSAAEWKIAFERRRVDVRPGGNLQARARTARYAALCAVQAERGCKWLATAHQSQDRAETVLLRLLRGAPPMGLAVLPPRDGDRIRPMLRASKDDVLAHLSRHGVPWAEDPSNRDARFLRVRVRRELLPLLLELSSGVLGHLNALADELRAEILPEIFDSEGHPLRLGRAQRHELRRALRDRSSRARVLLRGARSLRLDPAGDQPRVTLAPEAAPGRLSGSKKPKKG